VTAFVIGVVIWLVLVQILVVTCRHFRVAR
jgi:hypothetical protein